MENLPNDIMMLFSYVNTKLRDEYESLSTFCDDLEIEQAWLEARLAEGGFEYNEQQNKFW